MKDSKARDLINQMTEDDVIMWSRDDDDEVNEVIAVRASRTVNRFTLKDWFDVVIDENGNTKASNVTGPDGAAVKGSPHAADKIEGKKDVKEDKKKKEDKKVSKKSAKKVEMKENKVKKLDKPNSKDKFAHPHPLLLQGLTDNNKICKDVTKILGLDCEMVGVGRKGFRSILARVSIVNQYGYPLYDTFVAPTEKVTDYRTSISGVRPKDLKGAPRFKDVQKKVAKMIKGKILVGHAINNDLKVLNLLDHPKELIRDTSQYKPFRAAVGGKNPGLKKLSEKFLGVQIQGGEHSSVEDSQAAMSLYMMFREEWEDQLKNKNKGKNEDKEDDKKGKNEKKNDAKNGKDEEKKDAKEDAKKDNKKDNMKVTGRF